MIHIGISLGFNASACAVDDKGNILRAISEERLTREKNTKCIPVNAIAFVRRVAKNLEEINSELYYSHYDVLNKEYFDKYEPNYDYQTDKTAECNLRRLIYGKTGLDFTLVRRINHHTAHAYSIFPYYKVPRKSIILTSDGYGDNESETLRFADNTLEYRYIEKKDSLALVYQFVTGALGLKMHQHEGKVTGLAAYGCYDQANMLLDTFIQKHSKSSWQWNSKYNTFEELQDAVFDFCRDNLDEDFVVSENNKQVCNLCLMAQLFIEREMIKRIDQWWKPEYKNYHLFLAGGLFANVRLNYKIALQYPFKSVNVAPPMGDEGTSVGAVLAGLRLKPKGKFENVFSGVPAMLNGVGQIKTDRYSFHQQVHWTDYSNEKELIAVIATELARGSIIHYCDGLSEFGPRALCHRTTFYQPSDPEGTKLLNRTLGRSEYMPYAPIILKEDLWRLFEKVKSLENSLQYMTATVKWNGTEDVKKYAGALHIDLTARPQVLNDKKSFAYRLLKSYKRMTGINMLINTSYNIHNNPTVATIDDAMLTWVESGFCGDALVIGKRMYYKKVNND